MPFGLGNARGVLISNTMGKVYARMLRRWAAPHLTLAGFHTQYGGRPRQSIDMAAHHLALMASNARLKKRSFGALFVDFRAAFYSAMLDTTLGQLLPQHRREELETRETEKVDNCMDSWGVPAWLQRSVREWHMASFFEVPQIEGKYTVEVGARPGDSLADLVFNTVVARFAEDLSWEMKAAGLLDRAPTPADNFWSEATEEEKWMDGPFWLDDLAIGVSADKPEELTSRILQTTDIVARTGRKYGLDLNFTAGKTECVPVFCGQGANKVREDLREEIHMVDGTIAEAATLTTKDGHKLRLLQKYKHLGSMFCRTASMWPEIRRRCAMATTTAVQLGPKWLSRKDVPKKLRYLTVVACIDAVIFGSAGWWPQLTKSQLAHIEAARSRAFLRVAGIIPGKDAPQPAIVRAMVGAASAEVV